MIEERTVFCSEQFTVIYKSKKLPEAECRQKSEVIEMTRRDTVHDSAFGHLPELGREMHISTVDKQMQVYQEISY
jgi:hypothetical protein